MVDPEEVGDPTSGALRAFMDYIDRNHRPGFTFFELDLFLAGRESVDVGRDA